MPPVRRDRDHAHSRVARLCGLEALDLSWFELGAKTIPTACSGGYAIDRGRDDVVALADSCDFHGYLKKEQDIVKFSGVPLVEMDLGKGRVVASEMTLEAAPSDPIARRLLGNLLHLLMRP